MSGASDHDGGGTAVAAPPVAPTRMDPLRQAFEVAVKRQQAGDVQGAIEAYNRIIDLAPANPDAYNNLAILLKAAKRIPAAIACLRRALIATPQSAALHSNLGNMLWMGLEFEESMVEFRRALVLDATRPETHHNLGLLYFSLGNFGAALESYDRSIALNPEGQLVKWDRALALLASGDLARGFEAYDIRFDLRDASMGFDRRLQAVREIKLPLWNGEPLAGRTIWIHPEQGFGDTIQFVRFLPELARRGARVIFDCPPELVRLMANLPGVAELRAEGGAMPAADFHLPLMSLPHRLGVRLESVPAHVPYLVLPPSITAQQLARPAGTRLAVGICWAGRPQHANDYNRSIALEQFLKLCDIPGLTLFSLQKGSRAGELAELCAQPLVRDLGPQIQDFADTARLMQQLDLIITIDTSVAHLAGALARTTIVLVPFTPDWRWLGGREDCPWYPTLRLFRQPAPGDWKSVMHRVHDTLAQALATRQ